MKLFRIISRLFRSAPNALPKKKSVAVLPPLAGKDIGETVKRAVRTAISDYISSSRRGHQVLDWRTTDAAYEEFCEKRSSLLDAKGAMQIGKRLGAKYVCMAELNREAEYIYFECHLVNAETGKARTACERSQGTNNEDVSLASVSAAKMLFTRGSVSNDETTVRVAMHKKSLYLVTGSGDARKYWKNGQKTDAFEMDGFPWHRRLEHKSGSYEVGMDGKCAVVKKNGALLHRLTDGAQAADVLGVAVHERSVYAIGWEANRLGNNVATLWKNGHVCHRLVKGGRHSSACSICIHAGDVYAVGYEHNGLENGVATVWKNDGVFACLTNGNFYAAARSICFAGSDYYVAGYERNGAGEDVTTIWKNGEVLFRLDKERLLVNDYLIFAR